MRQKLPFRNYGAFWRYVVIASDGKKYAGIGLTKKEAQKAANKIAKAAT